MKMLTMKFRVPDTISSGTLEDALQDLLLKKHPWNAVIDSIADIQGTDLEEHVYTTDEVLMMPPTLEVANKAALLMNEKGVETWAAEYWESLFDVHIENKDLKMAAATLLAQLQFEV